MKVREKKWIRFRVYTVAFFFMAGMSVILARAYQLQVLERERLASIARAGYRGTIKLPPKRGTIYDREGHELAISIEVASIYAHPNQIPDKQLAARELSSILNLKQSSVLSLLESKRSFVWIARKIAPEKAKQILSLKLEGVGTTPESRRYYPGREIAAQLIGFAGEDNQGLEGVEKKFESLLKGPDYTLVQMRDALRRPFYISRPSSNGHEMRDVVLTIDKDIQYKAEQTLKEVVEKTRAKSGHCVIVNPRTGEILGMAVAPLFNPNAFDKFNPAHWRNQTITDCFEPGSTMKAFLMAAALDSGIAKPETAFFCENGSYTIGSATIHEHDAKKYGSMTLTDIVMVSSNIGAVKVGQKLGYKKFHEYLKKFGFGEKTGLDLLGEREGFVRSPKDIKEIEKATTYFGQGVTTTSLQLVMAMSAIANQGLLMKPYIVKAVKDQQGRVVKEFKPRLERRVISPEAAQNAARILETVVSDKGTAKLAAIGGYRVAGKTGTSQKVDPRTRAYSRRAHMAVFVGFVPSDDPRLAMVVVVDEPGGIPYGGVVAAPIFKQVGAWTLNHLRINPQINLAEPVVSQEAADQMRVESLPAITTENDGGLLPNFRGLTMRQVIKEGKNLGIRVMVEGTGLAVAQIPEAGSSLERVSSVRVNFMPSM
ncbi:MAG: penicillin-binding protein [Deltaproteobacteria bacterium HGW-Deltaproteobacteria-15]|jgi:cell division protein FtsI (penicillin-binding protein 3)|nr:MAG: penicillin-binding protein [Deltaproteobacteria bacterium HGW-Deltaproteobacteria-15]